MYQQDVKVSEVCELFASIDLSKRRREVVDINFGYRDKCPGVARRVEPCTASGGVASGHVIPCRGKRLRHATIKVLRVQARFLINRPRQGRAIIPRCNFQP